MNKKKDKIKNLFKKKVLVLDGAMGTELQGRGMPPGVCPEIWCLDNPHVVQDIHREYRRSGSDMVYTCTFGANRMKLGQYGVSNVTEINRELALMARRAVGEKGLVAGDIGPTGHFIEPFGDVGFEEAVGIFKEQVRGLIEGGVDLFAVETMMDIQEARAALIAIKEMIDMFAIVTMTYEKGGRTLNGTDPVTAVITLQSLGADAVGCNCSVGPEEMIPLIAEMKPYATVPIVAKPNAGIPELREGQTVFTMLPKEFATWSAEFIPRGVNAIGGCCGTTPDHIREMQKVIAGTKHMAPVRKSVSAVSSSRKTVFFGNDSPLRVIGERINPSGKKQFQEELLRGEMSLARTMAREQENSGSDLLDVNVSFPGVDEQKTMEAVIAELSVASPLPLVIDSSDVDVMEKALRCYPGRALVNSITGEKEKVKKLLPVAAKYGAMFILLPVTDEGVPEKSDERIEVIKKVFKKAEEYRFRKDDVLIDGLVMTVSSSPEAPLEALKTVEWSARKFKGNAILGLTNVSFGMPDRKWLNAAFLAMAIERGLAVTIANPEVEELMNCKVAGEVLIGRDPDAARYLDRFATTAQPVKKDVPAKAMSPAEGVARSVFEGNRDTVVGALREALDEGMRASELVQDIMIPAITEAGELFDRKEYFLPQLIASAEAMKKGLAYLEPYLTEDRTSEKRKGLIIIATVQGDIHDIGKNIVTLMLGNHGFKVIDLGKDVKADRIVEEAKRSSADIIALSALMTTTMVNMNEVIEVAKREGLDCGFMVGGAVVTDSYATGIGAHYARDGVEAVRVAQRLVKK